MGKRHGSGFTHQVVQHPHEGLELGLAHFPLDLPVHHNPGSGHSVGQGFELLSVQQHEVVHAAGTAQRTHLKTNTITKLLYNFYFWSQIIIHSKTPLTISHNAFANLLRQRTFISAF